MRFEQNMDARAEQADEVARRSRGTREEVLLDAMQGQQKRNVKRWSKAKGRRTDSNPISRWRVQQAASRVSRQVWPLSFKPWP